MEAVEHFPLAIIGAGQAGLATVHAANQHGLRPLVLESAAYAGGSWPSYYDSLILFSPARFSSLPGQPMPGDPERYPLRDEVVDYLRDYAARLDVDLRHNQPVSRVGRRDGRLLLTTADGSRFDTDTLICASGRFTRPFRAALPGLPDFTGTVVHTADYRSPTPFTGRRVVVVGGGNSGVQIAAELADVARVSLTTRAPLAWANQRPLGRDIHWWFVRTGLDVAPLRRMWERLPTLVNDDGRYRAAFASGNPDQRPLFTRLEQDKITWADGTVEEVDALILATGYRPALDYLAGTAALDDHGRPLHRSGISTSVPGLGFVGLEFQRSFSSATLRGVGRDARYVLRHLRRRKLSGLRAAPAGRSVGP